MTADGRRPTAQPTAQPTADRRPLTADGEPAEARRSGDAGRTSAVASRFASLSAAGGRRSAVRGLSSVVLLAVLLLAFGLRAHRIGDQRVWWDEGWSVWAARFPVTDILRETGNDVHPPLYFTLLHLWRTGSGDSEAGLRLLSASLGLLTVAVTYALGRSMARGHLPPGAARAVGLLAALLLTVSRFAIAWSQEIRMYALATLLGVLAVWAARRVWVYGRRRDAAAYVLLVTAGLYTLYLFAPVWLAINVAWLLAVWARGGNNFPRSPAPPLPRSPAPRPPALWLGLQLLILALFAPWAIYAAGGFLSTASATPIRLLDFLHIYWTVLTVGIPVDVAQFNWLTLPALAIFVVAVTTLVWTVGKKLTQRRQEAKTQREETGGIGGQRALTDVVFLLAVLLLPVVLVYFISLPRQNFYNPPFNPRYLVIFTPFYSMLLAWGLGVVATRGRTSADHGRQTTDDGQRVGRGLSSVVAPALLTVAAAIFMLTVALVGLWPYYPGRIRIDDYPSLVSTLAAQRQPGDSVILYTDTDWPIFAFHHPEPWRGVPHLWAMTPELAGDFLTPIWADHDAVWLVTTPYSAAGDPERFVPGWLAERATAVRAFNYGDMALTLYTRTAARAAAADAPAADAPSPRPLAIPLPNGAITGYTQATRDFRSGDTARLFLFYTATTESDITVALLDAAGNAWGATATTLPAAPEWGRRQIDLLVPPDAPSGDYRFTVVAGEAAPFGRLTIRQKNAALLTEADVTIGHRLDAPFAGGVRLLGYDLAAEQVRPGEAVELTLYWSADGPLAPTHKVFTHLLGETFNATGGNFLWGQSDAEPAANTRPTTTWRSGEVIVDSHLIPVAADAPAGRYTLEVGLYEPTSGARLAVVDATGAAVGDHVVVATVVVAP